MGGAQAFEPRDLGFEPGFLHEARIAGGDGLGHGELVDLRLPASSSRRMLRSPDIAMSMKRAFLSSICQPVASTLPFVA